MNSEIGHKDNKAKIEHNIKNADKNSKKVENNAEKTAKTKQNNKLKQKNHSTGDFLGKATNPDIFTIKTEKAKMNQVEISENTNNDMFDLNKKNSLDLNKKSIFKGKGLVAVLLVFVITIFAVMSVILSGNFSSQNSITANATNTRIVQAKLASLGYFEGDIDGVYDNSTIDAIKSFQADKNLAITGSLDSATTVALGVTDNAQANTDLYLLAKLIYSEARGEVYQGQVAVGAVVLNRVSDAGFPNTLQGVIYQPWAFTALHDGQFSLEPNSTAYQAAQDAMNGWDPTYGCLYYYNPKTATSSWIFSRQIIVTIGNHVFCV